MRSKFFNFLFVTFTLLIFTSCSDNGANNTQTATGSQTASTMDTAHAAAIREEPVTYTADGQTMNGYVAYDEKQTGKRPVVLVVHEWWGLTDYPRSRARQLAALGYFAMAVDMYGGGKIAANPQEAMDMTKPFYGNPALSKTRLNAALATLKDFNQADLNQAAAIGYCFGGSVVLNAAKLGADLEGVVSFHGGLSGAPANKDLLKAKILVCHGGADSLVPQAEVTAFRKGMDSIGANYQFKVYPDATHAFTNPEATALGEKFKMPIAYNPAADTASWSDMKSFLNGIFQK
jgi:dienelactone hydrolase